METFALEFANVGKTYVKHTYCDIKYSFETDNGVKTKKERVNIEDEPYSFLLELDDKLIQDNPNYKEVENDEFIVDYVRVFDKEEK